MTAQRLTIFRGLAMLASIICILALSRGSTGWAQVAQAQTVPTLTFTPPPTLVATPRPTAISPTDTPVAPSQTPAPTSAAATSTAGQPADTQSPPAATKGTSAPASPTVDVSAELAACGPAPYSLEAPAANAPVALVLGEGTLTLLTADGLDSQGNVPMTVDRFGAEIVPVPQLPAAPAGWGLMSCGLRSVATDIAVHTIGFLTHGLTACLVPPQAVSPGTDVRLAYFDARPDINRWVFLSSQNIAGDVCSAPFRLPGTFALLTRSP